MSQQGLSVALNSAREASSAEYQANVPVVDEATSIEVFSAPLLNVPRLFNEFADNLIQRIVYTQFFSKVYKNPLKVLEGDKLPLGYMGQELFTNPAVGRDFDADDFAGCLKKYEADVKVQYQGINFDKQYPITVNRQKLKQAFVSWATLESYITDQTNSLYNGYYIDEYNNTKAIVTRAYLSNAVQIQTINKPTTEALSKQFVKMARTLFLNFQTPTDKYNAWSKVGGYGRAIETFTNPEDIVLLIKNEIRSELDVDVLATAFNVDKTTLMGNILPVNDFNIYDRKTGKVLFDGSKILGIIADKSWFRIKEQDLYIDDFKNANNRSINYYLNAIKLFNYSYFANAVVFATEEPTISITSLDFKAPEGISILNVGDSEGIEITVNPNNANSPTITYKSDNKEIFTVEKISERECKITATGQGTANLTATAGNVSTSVSVTVENA
jgi:uncharacterized protein YjdB